MALNYFSFDFSGIFPAVLLKDRDTFLNASTHLLPYVRYAYLPTLIPHSNENEDFPDRGFRTWGKKNIPYVKEAFDYAKTGNSFIFAPDRRIVFVTNSIYQAARVAILFDRKYGNVQCQTSPFYHFGVTSVSSQIHADSLRIYDFSEAQRYENSDDILNSPAIRELPAECSQLYIGMRDYHDPVKMVRALNNAGGKFQFFMVSEEDLYTDWFDALQREENTHIIRLSEPDDSYYRGIVEELVGVLERTFDITLGDIDAGRIVYLARLKYGIGINRNLSEEDLVWYINKAVLYASAQKRDAIMAEDFEKFLPDHQDL